MDIAYRSTMGGFAEKIFKSFNMLAKTQGLGRAGCMA